MILFSTLLYTLSNKRTSYFSSPFIPPVNLQNPLEENNFNFVQQRGKRFSLPEEYLQRSKRNSEDIRSVVELLSIRRNTICSLQSYNSNELKLIHKSSSFQSFGHLSHARDARKNGGGSLNSIFSNLTVVNTRQLLTDTRHNNDVQQESGMTTNEIRQIREQLYTPLTTVHRDNIVADCIPYNRDAVDESLVTSAIELRKNMRKAGDTLEMLDAISLSNTQV